MQVKMARWLLALHDTSGALLVLGFCLIFQEEMMVQENPIELEKTMA